MNKIGSKGDSTVAIVIPTRERCHTLKYTIKTCVNQDYENLKIYICDNCSKDKTREVIKRFTDRRIVYLNPEKRLSMADNWEFALKNVDADYVTILGDDDGLLPGAITAAMSLLRKHNSTVLCWRKVEYTWPDHPNPDWANKLIVPMDNKVLLIPGSVAFDLIINFWLGYNCGPSIYNSILSMDLVKKISNRDGRLFRSTAPDVFSSLVFSKELKSYLFASRPFSLNGASSSSNGTSSVTSVDEKNESPRNEFVKEYFGADFDKKAEFALIKGSITAAIADSIVAMAEKGLFRISQRYAKKLFFRIIRECAYSKSLDATNIRILSSLSVEYNCQKQVDKKIQKFLKIHNNISDSVYINLTGNLSKAEFCINTELFNIKDVYSASLLAEKILDKYEMPDNCLKFSKIGYFLTKLLQRLHASKFNMGI